MTAARPYKYTRKITENYPESRLFPTSIMIENLLRLEAIEVVVGMDRRFRQIRISRWKSISKSPKAGLRTVAYLVIHRHSQPPGL